jgi:prolyl 4-hydroxylase
VSRADPALPEALAAAADAGDADSAHRLAVLGAMGLGLPQDWGTALKRLTQAAELGHATAGRQLALLSDGPVLEGRRRDPAGGVDMAAWLNPPPPRMLSEGPAIFAIEGFLPDAVCDWLKDRARALAEPALVYDPETGVGRREGVRTNAAAQFGLERMDVVLAVVRERIARAAGLPVPGLEWTQVLHYAVGQAFDWLDPATPGYAADLAARGQRIATCLVFLNDDFEGGETAFEAGGLRHRGRKGDALMWANTLPDGSIDRRTRHAGLPPTRGEKWVLSQWLRGRAPLA